MRGQLIDMWDLINMELPPKGEAWGPWRYNRDNLTLEFWRGQKLRYYVDLERCRNSAEILDWVAQVSDKSWASDADVGQLVRALNGLLHLQNNICSSGVDHEIDPKVILSH
ncbi:MAG: hypothetical protein HW403_536 [Dehalococcoidia bacterium]|nr:hypothetical protein [Dehalococcoidia bacterium]